MLLDSYQTRIARNVRELAGLQRQLDSLPHDMRRQFADAAGEFWSAVYASEQNNFRNAPSAHREREAVEREFGVLRSRLNSFYMRLPGASYERALTAGATTGSYLVDTGAGVPGALFAEGMRAASVVKQAGARELPAGRPGNAGIPQVATGATAYMVAEGSAITESNPTFGNAAASPKILGGLTRMSGQLMKEAPVLAMMVVTSELGAATGALLDAQALGGDGSPPNMRGLVNISGVASVSGTSFARATAVDMVYEVRNAGAVRDAARLAYALPAAGEQLLAKRETVTNSGIYVLEAGRMNGLPAYASNGVPASTVLLADWSQVAIVQWLDAVEIAVDPFTLFQSGTLQIRSFYLADVVALQPKAICKATSVT